MAAPRMPRLLATIEAVPSANAAKLVGMALVAEVVTGCMVKVMRGTSGGINGEVVLVLLSAGLTLAGFGTWLKNKDADRAAAAPCDPSPKAP